MSSPPNSRSDFPPGQFVLVLSDEDLERADAVLEAALTVEDWRTAVIVAVRMAWTQYVNHEFWSSAYYADVAHGCLHLSRIDTPRAAALELRILSMCTLTRFATGHYAAAQTFLEEADRVAERVVLDGAEPRLRRASLHWTGALLDHWRGEHLAALGRILLAYPVYLELSPPHELVRLRIQIADMALDAAAKTAGAEANQLLRLARAHLEHARPQPGPTFDPGVDGIFSLAYAKFSRLSGRNEGRVALIESVEHVGQQLNDFAVRGQALTALGAELDFLGERESALNCFRLALDALAHSPAPALMVWPRRALLRHQEMHVE